MVRLRPREMVRRWHIRTLHPTGSRCCATISCQTRIRDRASVCVLAFQQRVYKRHRTCRRSPTPRPPGAARDGSTEGPAGSVTGGALPDVERALASFHGCRCGRASALGPSQRSIMSNPWPRCPGSLVRSTLPWTEARPQHVLAGAPSRPCDPRKRPTRHVVRVVVLSQGSGDHEASPGRLSRGFVAVQNATRARREGPMA